MVLALIDRRVLTSFTLSCAALLLGACKGPDRVGPTVVVEDGLFKEFGSYCTSEAPSGCASISLRVTYVGDGTSVLLVRISNFQGTNPRDNTGGWRLSNLAFGTRERGGNSQGMASFGLLGTVGSYGSPDLSYPFDPISPMIPDTSGAPLPGIVLVWHNASQTHGIVGCTQMPLEAPSNPFPFLGAWQTCPALGQDGAFYVAIRMSWELVDANALFVNWAGPAAGGAFVNCDTRFGGTCVATPGPVLVAQRAADAPLLLHDR